MTFSRSASSNSSLGTLGVSIGMQNLQKLHIKVIGVAKNLLDCVKLISKAPLLAPIVDELLNILYTKLAWVEYFSGLHSMTVGFRSNFYPTRIVKDKAWATRVCYLVVDHAHPTLEFLFAGWKNKWRCLSTRRTSNPALTSVG